MSNQPNETAEWLGGALSAVLALIVLAFSGLGWYAAKQGVSYRKVKVLLFPVAFVISQITSGLIFLCFGWAGAAIIGNTDAANYIVGHTPDLTLLTAVFNEVSLPWTHILLFQFLAWVIVGRRILRHLTFSVYDLAIQGIGNARGEHPFYIREQVRAKDTGYAKAELYYIKTGKPPLLGLLLIILSSTPVDEYY